MVNKKLFLLLLSVLVVSPSVLAASNNAFSGALQVFFDIFSLKWAIGAALEPATRMLFWLALFSAMYAILKMLSDKNSGMKWLEGRTAGILSFILATISAVFISPAAVLSVGSNWGAVGLLLLMLPVVIGVAYLVFKSGLSRWVKLLGVVLMIFFLDWMAIVLGMNPVTPVHSFFEDAIPYVVFGLVIYGAYLFFTALADALGGANKAATAHPVAAAPSSAATPASVPSRAIASAPAARRSSRPRSLVNLKTMAHQLNTILGHSTSTFICLFVNQRKFNEISASFRYFRKVYVDLIALQQAIQRTPSLQQAIGQAEMNSLSRFIAGAAPTFRNVDYFSQRHLDKVRAEVIALLNQYNAPTPANLTPAALARGVSLVCYRNNMPQITQTAVPIYDELRNAAQYLNGFAQWYDKNKGALP